MRLSEGNQTQQLGGLRGTLRPRAGWLARRLGSVCAVTWWCVLLAGAAWPLSAWAQWPSQSGTRGAWYDSFESAQPTWQPERATGPYEILRHQRSTEQWHTGRRSEWLLIRARAGTCVFLRHEAGRAAVIEDLLPTVWVKTDRAGVQLLARVVLPAAVDPRTGKPAVVVLPGSHYTKAGQWQQLRLDNLSELLARQVRVLRAQWGPRVDATGAWLESILLEVSLGPEPVNLWIDDLDLAGFVSAGQRLPARQVRPAGTIGSRIRADTSPAARLATKRHVQMAGTTLTADGEPFFLRAIEYRGEPLEQLQQLGFNAVWLDQVASEALLAEAARLGIWLISSPPVSPNLASPQAAAAEPISSRFDPVLAWNLGRGLSGPQFDGLQKWAEHVRPLQSDHRLAAGRTPAGGQQSGTGRVRHMDLPAAAPGSAGYTGMGSNPNPAGRSAAPAASLVVARTHTTFERLRGTDPLAGAGGPGFGRPGIAFPVRYAAGRRRSADALSCPSLVIEPWAASGTLQTTAQASEPKLASAVVRAGRTRLVLPMWFDPQAQRVVGQAALSDLWLVVPGVPESVRAYELVPGRVEPLKQKRVTGGLRIAWDEFDLAAAVVLAQDPVVVEGLKRRAAAGSLAASLQVELAQSRYQQVQQVLGEVGRRLPVPRQSGTWLKAARENLAWSARQLEAGDAAAAWLYARRAGRLLRLTERHCWQTAVAALPSPSTSPGTALFSTLPWHGRLLDRLGGSRLGPNLIEGGDFEDFHAAVAAGWVHTQQPQTGVEAFAELVGQAAHSGRNGLRLVARPVDPRESPGALEAPPVWITSGPVHLSAGTLICVYGWVQVRERRSTGRTHSADQRLAEVRPLPGGVADRPDDRNLCTQRPGRSLAG